MPDINVTIETTPPPTLNVFPALLPTQTGNAGKLLATNGSSASWTNEPTFKSAKAQDASFPLFELRCTTGPTDKKFVRWSADATGAVNIERVNDAYTAATRLISWDANNNCAVGLGAPQAKQHVFAPALSSAAQSVADIARWEINNGNVSSVRLIQVRNSTGGDWTTTTTRFFQATDVTAQGFIDFNPVGLSHGLALGTHHAGFPVAAINIVPGAGTNSVGIGTTSTPSKLTVEGDIRLLRAANANAGILFTDGNGTTPYLVSQADNNFVFYGTKTDGTMKAIWQCAMRTSTLSPFQINAPLKIGASGAAIAAVLTAGFYHQPGAIAANGGSLFLDVTLTGADSNTVCFVECNGGMSVNAIILKANVISGGVVRVYWINPTPSSVSLAGANYRVCAITFI